MNEFLMSLHILHNYQDSFDMFHPVNLFPLTFVIGGGLFLGIAKPEEMSIKHGYHMGVLCLHW